MSGSIAALCLPDDHRLHVQLSPYFYASTLATLRREVIADRAGIAVTELAVPITGPVIQVALDRTSVYVLGFRRVGDARWWAFHEKGRAPSPLPGGPCRPMGLTGSYSELGLPPSVNMPPGKLLDLLAAYAGTPDPQFCRGIVLLLFLVAEALRFDDVLMECAGYFSAGGRLATIRPAAFAPVVKNWARLSAAGDRNVLVRHLG